MSLAEHSVAYWQTHQVADFPADVSPEASLQALKSRNAVYPGLLELMPVEGFDGKTVLDFGCGPGHDTIGFLLNGAEHVFAVDCSEQGLDSLRARLRAHGFTRCSTYLGNDGWRHLRVDHVHAAGVIHHLADPVRTLYRLRQVLKKGAEIRMMVYDAASEFVKDCGGPAEFEKIADKQAPIAKAWTRDEVWAISHLAGLKADYLGGYRVPGETSGPGLSACYSLRP